MQDWKTIQEYVPLDGFLASPRGVFTEIARFCPKPVRVVLPQRESDLHPKRFSSSWRVFPERQNAVARPGVISSNGKTPLLPPV